MEGPADPRFDRPRAEAGASSATAKRDRSLRLWKRAAWCGGVLLLGPVLGLVVSVYSMVLSFRRIESAQAPTPGELAEGVRFGTTVAVAGGIAGAIGSALVLAAVLRIQTLRRTAADDDAARTSWR